MKTNIRKIVLLQIVFLCLGSSLAYSSYLDENPKIIARFYFEGKNRGNANIHSHYIWVVKSHYWNGDGSWHNGSVSKGYQATYICNKYDGLWYRHDNGDFYYPSGSEQSFAIKPDLQDFTFDYVSSKDEVMEWPSAYCGLEPPNPCEDKEGQASTRFIAEGRFLTKACAPIGDDKCEIIARNPKEEPVEGEPLGTTSLSYTYPDGKWVTDFLWPVFTGEECSDVNNYKPDGDIEDLEPNPDFPYAERCERANDACKDICENGVKDGSCDPVTGDLTCDCNNPLIPSPDTPSPEKPTDAGDGEQAPDDADATGKAIIKNQLKSLGNDQYLLDYMDDHGTVLRGIQGNTGEIIKAINDGQLGKGIGDAIGDEIGNDLGDIEDAIEGQATSDTMPAVPEFDSALPTENDYTEYDNTTDLAASKATEHQSLFDSLESPLDYSINTSGSNACLTGSILNASVKICFNEPWMLTGYAIMKIIMIAAAYLHVAILLNRAIVS